MTRIENELTATVHPFKAPVKEGCMSVSGHAVIKVAATLADVALCVEVTALDAARAHDSLATRVELVRQALKAKGLDQVHTGALTISPVYETVTEGLFSNTTTSKIVSYCASIRYTFSCPLSDTGALVEVAMHAGANKLLDVSVRASEEDEQKAREQAIRLASQRALKEGMLVLQTFPELVQLSGIEEILVSPQSYERKFHRAFDECLMNQPALRSRLQFDSEEIEVAANCTMRLSYRSLIPESPAIKA